MTNKQILFKWFSLFVENLPCFLTNWNDLVYAFFIAKCLGLIYICAIQTAVWIFGHWIKKVYEKCNHLIFFDIWNKSYIKIKRKTIELYGNVWKLSLTWSCGGRWRWWRWKWDLFLCICQGHKQCFHFSFFFNYTLCLFLGWIVIYASFFFSKPIPFFCWSLSQPYWQW